MRILFAGGPGAGKTTVLRLLHAQGLATVDDAARELIRERRSLGMSPRPEPETFAREVLARDLRNYDRVIGHQGPVFFDRGIPDSLGMLLEAAGFADTEVAAHLKLRPHHHQAFIFPPWQAIYVRDDERDQSFDDSVAVHERAARWYRRCGFELIEVPCDSPEQRCRFVLGAIAA